MKDFEMVIDPNDLKTGMDVRDRHMRELVFQDSLGKIPLITIKAKEVSIAREEETAPFDVTFRGVTRRVPVRLKILNPQEAEANATINLSDFGVPELSFMGMTVDDNVSISVESIELAGG